MPQLLVPSPNTTRENVHLHVTDKEKATALYKHLKAQFIWERGGDIPPLSPSNYPRTPPPPPTIRLLTAGLEWVIKQLKLVNQNKISGPYELLSQIYHDHAEEVSRMPQMIFQQSYDEGNIPDDWTQALYLLSIKRDLHHPRPIISPCP